MSVSTTTKTKAPPEFRWDVFVSFSHTDREWVETVLVDRLEAAGLDVCVDYNGFEGGHSSLQNVERAIGASRNFVAVLSPAWIQSEWTQFEWNLLATTHIEDKTRKLIPLMYEACEPRLSVSALSYRDFQDSERSRAAWPLLLRDLGADDRRIRELSERGLVALLELRDAPIVADAVARSKGALRIVSDKIEEFGLLKQLHEYLQQLEYPFDMLVQTLKRARHDPTAWDEAVLVEVDFGLAVTRTLEIANTGRYSASHLGWGERLLAASEEIQLAVMDRDLERTGAAARRVEQVLGSEPSRLNGILVATARHLPFKSFADVIHGAVAGLSLGREGNQQLDNFNCGIAAVNDLNSSLDSRLNLHDHLQAIHDSVHPVDVVLLKELQDLEYHWRIQGRLLDHLREAGVKQLPEHLFAIRDRLETEVKNGNLQEARRRFLEYRLKTRRALHDADQDLLSLCQELSTLGKRIIELLGSK